MENPPDLSNMTNDELDFYYFHLHDTDKNKKLDGLEILQAIMHTSHSSEEGDVNGMSESEEFIYYVGKF